MTNGTLHFDLNDYEEKEKFLNAIKSNEMKLAIDTLYDDVFRPYLKYDVSIITGKTLTDTEREIVEAVLKKIQEHFANYDCNL